LYPLHSSNPLSGSRKLIDNWSLSGDFIVSFVGCGAGNIRIDDDLSVTLTERLGDLDAGD